MYLNFGLLVWQKCFFEDILKGTLRMHITTKVFFVRALVFEVAVMFCCMAHQFNNGGLMHSF